MIFVTIVARAVLGVALAVLACSKIARPAQTRLLLAGLGVSAHHLNAALVLLVLAEIVAAGVLLYGAEAWYGGILALALLVAAGIGAWRADSRTPRPAPRRRARTAAPVVGRWALVGDVLLGLLALFVVVAGPNQVSTSALDLLIGLGVLLIVVTSAEGWFWLSVAGGLALLGAALWLLPAMRR